MTSFGSLARNRDFTALWLGGTISELGTRVTTFALPLIGYAVTHSAGWAAACEALYILGMVAALLPAGVLADRVHRLRLMRCAMAGGAALYLSLVLAGLAHALTLAHLLAGALGSGILAGLHQPVESSAIRAVVTAEELPTALSQQQGRQHVASLLGGPLGGVLFGIARWAPFLADAVSYAVGWVLLGRIRTDLSSAATADATGQRPRPAQDLAEGFRFTWAQPLLRVLLAWSPAINLTINALFFVALLRLVEAGFPGWQIGLVEAAIGASGILGALAAPWLIERFRTGLLTIAVAWSFVPLAVPLALWNHPAAMAAAVCAGLFVVPAGNAGMASYRIAITPPNLVGRVQATAQFVSMLSMPLAPLLGGLLLEVTGGSQAILALTALTALVALVPTLSRAVWAVPRPADWPTGPEPGAAPASSLLARA